MKYIAIAALLLLVAPLEGAELTFDGLTIVDAAAPAATEVPHGPLPPSELFAELGLQVPAGLTLYGPVSTPDGTDEQATLTDIGLTILAGTDIQPFLGELDGSGLLPEDFSLQRRVGDLYERTGRQAFDIRLRLRSRVGEGMRVERSRCTIGSCNDGLRRTTAVSCLGGWQTAGNDIGLRLFDSGPVVTPDHVFEVSKTVLDQLVASLVKDAGLIGQKFPMNGSTMTIRELSLADRFHGTGVTLRIRADVPFEGQTMKMDPVDTKLSLIATNGFDETGDSYRRREVCGGTKVAVLGSIDGTLDVPFNGSSVGEFFSSLWRGTKSVVANVIGYRQQRNDEESMINDVAQKTLAPYLEVLQGSLGLASLEANYSSLKGSLRHATIDVGKTVEKLFGATVPVSLVDVDFHEQYVKVVLKNEFQ